MANNESGNGHDPWKRNDDQPMDLDQIARQWQKRFERILGGGGSGAAGASGGIALVLMLLIAWGLTGFYRVDEAERGVVQRFGKHMPVSDTQPVTMPGLRWHWPFPIEKVDIVNTLEVSDFNFSKEMLTADEWYVFIDIAVQYRRTDPVKYSFEVEDPDKTLNDVTESALRGVVGTSSLASLIGERRGEIPARTMVELQETLEDYGAGLTVTSININSVNYPSAVEDAVADTQRARNDKERYQLEADRYSNDILPRALGQEQRILQDAEAYRERVIAGAEGQAARFEALLTEYQKAPRVTRDRLYIDAIEEVYGRSAKVIIDTQGSGNLLYLPVDQLMKRSGASPNTASGSSSSADLGQTVDAVNDGRTTSRDRRTRE